MAYDLTAKLLAVKAIGTVESRLNYSAINYGDPITTGIMQWYGVRAAAILCRMRDENPKDWSGVASTIEADLSQVVSDDPWWNQRRLTETEGESLRPVLAKNEAIQIQQATQDMEVYRGVAVANGFDDDGNTDSMIFFFSMYHQGPVYAFQVLEAVGAGATLEEFRDGALNNPVLGQYSNRYNEVYEIIKSGDVEGTPTDPGDGGGEGTVPEDPEPAPASARISYLEPVGQGILIHFENENISCYPTGSGRWLPRTQPKSLTPAPADPETPPTTPDPSEPTPDPGTTPGGEWVHPLPGATLTSGYGYREGYDQPGLIHAGLDLSTTTAERGGDIIAPCDLEITQAMNFGDGGFDQAGGFVKGITRSGEKYTLTFIHMAPGSVAVSKGDKVKRGTKLGVEGQTGNAFGTHCHFEMWEGHITTGFAFDSPWYYGDGTPVNPLPILRANGVNI